MENKREYLLNGSDELTLELISLIDLFVKPDDPILASNMHLVMEHIRNVLGSKI